MASDVARLLTRMMEAADGKENGGDGKGFVYTGPSSQIRNLQVLTGDGCATAPGKEDVWDPNTVFDCPTWVWGADDAVTQDGVVTAWPAKYHPANESGEAVPVNSPTREANVFGRGARRFPGVPPGEPWLCRHKDYVSDPVLMRPEDPQEPCHHTLVFWVWPDTLPAETEERTICCAWTGATDRRSYWLGLVGDETGARFTYRATTHETAQIVVAVQSGIVTDRTWYRVVAQFAPVGEGEAKLRLWVGDDNPPQELVWIETAFPAAQIAHGAKHTFQIGGAPESPHRIWRGRMTHGYYYREAISDTAVAALVGQGVDAPVDFDDLGDTEGADIENLESMWPLDENSGGYVFDELGRNNMHWGHWWLGSAPLNNGYPGIRLVRSGTQFFTCDAVADHFAGKNVPMTLFVLLQAAGPYTPNQADGLVGLGCSSSSMPYRMWTHHGAYHRDYHPTESPVWKSATATLWEGDQYETEAVLPQTMQSGDAAAHVLCTVWRAVEEGEDPNAGLELELYVDDAVEPATPWQDMDELRSMPFDRFSFGAIRRGGADVIYPFDGYIGMVAVVARALDAWERQLMMQWMKIQAGLA